MFVNGSFASLFPCTSLNSRLGPASDHVPLHLTAPTSTPKSNCFKLENAWLKHFEFLPSTLPAWAESSRSSDATGALVARIKAFWHSAKAWARAHRARPADLNNASFVILLLDLYEENQALSAGERRLRDRCRDRVALLIEQRAAY